MDELNQTNHEEILKRLDMIDSNQLVMTRKIDPMYDVFTSVNGFNKIIIWIMKALTGIGAALVGLYALIEFLKKIGRP